MPTQAEIEVEMKEPRDGVWRGLPELYALAQQEALEKKHGCKLKFLHVRMGGSIYPVGHPEFKDMPTVSVWSKNADAS